MASNEVAVRFIGSMEGLTATVTQVREVLEGLTSPIRGVRAQLGELAEAFAAAFAVEKIKQFAEHMGEIGDRTERTSEKLGVTTEDVGRLGLVARLSGVSMDALQNAFARFSLKMVEGSDTTKRALSAVGLSAEQLRGRGTMEVLETLADRFSKIENGAAKTAIAEALFGKAGVELIPTLNKGRDAMAEIGQQAAELGIVLDKNTVDALANTNRQFTLLSAAVEGANIQAFLPLKGIVDGTVQIFIDLAKSFTEAMKSGGAIKDIVVALGAAFKVLVTALAGAVLAFKEVWAIGVAFIDVIGLDFIGLGKSIADVWNAVKGAAVSFFEGLVAAAKETVSSVGTMFSDLGSVLSAAFHGDFAGAKTAFDTMKTNADGAGAKIKESFSKSLKGIDWTQFKNEFSTNSDDAAKIWDNLLKTDKDNAKKFWDEMAQIWGTGAKHASDEGKKNTRMAGPTDQDMVSAASKSIEGQIKLEQLGLQKKLVIWGNAVKNFEMFELTRYNLVADATNKEYDKEVELLKKEAALPGQKLAKIQEINNKIRELEITHQTGMIKIQQDAIEAMKKNFDQVFSAFQSAFNSQLRGLLAGTTKFKDAFKSIIGDMLISFIQAVEKMAFEWISSQLAIKTVGIATQTEIAAAQQTTMAASMADVIAKALKAIAASVGQVIAGVTAFLSPEIGPAAIPAGIAAGAAVEGAATAFTETGWWNVPKVSPAILHPGEMVVPKPFADDLRQNGGMGGDGVHLHLNVNAIDRGSVQRFFKENADSMARTLKVAYNNNRSARPAY